LRRQMIALVELILAENVKDAGVTVEIGGMDLDFVQDASQSAETVLGLLERNPPDQTVDFISQTEQMFRQVTTVLASDSRNERFFLHNY
jgi:hypothetical protein